MSNDDRREHPLPVTAEVGGEGGSFADSTMQVATFSEDPGIRRTEGHGGLGSVATQATRSETVAAGGLSDATDPSAGMVRHPTEPPGPPLATEGLRYRSSRWRTRLIGAAAGAALAVGFLTRRAK